MLDLSKGNTATMDTVGKPPLFLNENFKELLDSIGRSRAHEYHAAEPFPHAVIDGLFPDHVLESILEEFPSTQDSHWHEYKNARERKSASTTEAFVPTPARLFLFQLNSSVFIDFLENLTGIRGLISDPHLLGGGMHQILRGGYLDIHVDFNRHPRLQLDRRINILVYLNKNWKEEYGGYLELWNRDATECVKKIAPLFNRTVIFNTTDISFHGHPNPLKCPENISRKSLALYYYSNPTFNQ